MRDVWSGPWRHSARGGHTVGTPHSSCPRRPRPLITPTRAPTRRQTVDESEKRGQVRDSGRGQRSLSERPLSASAQPGILSASSRSPLEGRYQSSPRMASGRGRGRNPARRDAARCVRDLSVPISFHSPWCAVPIRPSTCRLPPPSFRRVEPAELAQPRTGLAHSLPVVARVSGTERGGARRTKAKQWQSGYSMARALRPPTGCGNATKHKSEKFENFRKFLQIFEKF